MRKQSRKNLGSWLLIVGAVALLLGLPVFFGMRLLGPQESIQPPAAPAPLPTEIKITPRLSRLLSADLQVTNMIPRDFQPRLPEELPRVADAKQKKRLFVSTLLPVVLRANEMILLTRGRLLAIRQKLESQQTLSAKDKAWLKDTAKRFRLKRRKSFRTQDIDIMLYRVDVIPPSLALAQAAMETGWGTSRFAQAGNALFGEWVWGDAEGILPERREVGKTHKIKKFDHLLGSVSSYMTNLNRHPSYEDLRRRRAELRELNIPVTGAALAPALVRYSERGADYVSDILSIINFNDLDGLDSARLVTQSS